MNTNVKQLKTVSLLGSTGLLTYDGDLLRLDELAGDYESAATIAFKAPHGKVKFGIVNNFRPSDLTVNEITKIYLSNGHVISATQYDQYINAEGVLMSPEDLKEGDSISIISYNPRTRFLSSMSSRIDTLYRSELKQAEFLYDVDFLAKDCYPLLSCSTEDNKVSCVAYNSILLSSNGEES